jgi:hypothetical protein
LKSGLVSLSFEPEEQAKMQRNARMKTNVLNTVREYIGAGFGKKLFPSIISFWKGFFYQINYRKRYTTT